MGSITVSAAVIFLALAVVAVSGRIVTAIRSGLALIAAEIKNAQRTG